MTLVGVTERGYRVGETHHRAKLTNVQVDLIRELHDTRCIGYKRIGRAFGVAFCTVRRVVLCESRFQRPARLVRR